jgi:hypothetical protein
MYNVINWNNGLAFSSPFIHETADFIAGSMLAAHVDIMRWGDSGWCIEQTVPASDWLAALTPAERAVPANLQPAADKRKTRQKLYKAQILTAGGWELITGGFSGTLPDCRTWLASHVPACAEYLTIYRGVKNSGGLWSAAYSGPACSPVFVLISSEEARQLA